ncbi:MAG TPA: VOC family protein [Planctomycetota bacterium]|nr:VOC family protein [Planctomycetota bacterium]
MKVGSTDFPLAHLAIAVKTLAEGAPLYAALGFTLHEPETIEREKVRVQLASKGELHIELLEANPAGEGPIARFLEKRGPGLHHVALSSTDLARDLAALQSSGVVPLKGYPAPGAAGTQVAFLDPKTTGGVLIELVAPRA